MGSVKLTEKNKDRILDLLLVLSVGLLLTGVFRGSVSRKADTPNKTESALLHLRPLAIKQLPTYTELEAIQTPDSSNNPTVNTKVPNSTSSVVSGNMSKKPLLTTQPTTLLVPQANPQIVNIPQTLRGILKQTLF